MIIFDSLIIRILYRKRTYLRGKNMTTKEILEVLQKEIHTTIIATVDEDGKPYTCAIDMMLLEDEKLYFLTARGKSFYQRLMKYPYISLTGLKGEDTMTSIAISLQGKVKNINHHKLKDIFEINSYMKEIYPDEKSRDVLQVFEICEIQGEYFDLSQKPIFRQSFSNQNNIAESGYFVNDKCIGCLKCYEVCPQKCIDISIKPVKINQSHCLHCGKCQEICPSQAIIKR